MPPAFPSGRRWIVSEHLVWTRYCLNWWRVGNAVRRAKWAAEL